MTNRTNGLLLFQIGAALATIMGGLGLTLAVIGLYGVISYAVGRHIIVGIVLAMAALASCYFPARYATTVEPMVALRED